MAKVQFDNKTGEWFCVAPNGKRYSSKRESYITWRASQIDGSGETVQASKESFEEDMTSNKYDVNLRFQFITNFVTMVADKSQPSVIIAGPGGLGKSVTVIKALKAAGLTDVSNTESFNAGERLPHKRFRAVKGHSTAKALYRTLYENKDSILLFDDCDSVLRDETASNLLKAVCDSCDERIVSWNAESIFGDDLPRSFRFTGGIIFITNMDKRKLSQALRTRSIVIDVSMTTEEKMIRMTKIAYEQDFMPEADQNIKKLALDVLYKYKYKDNVKDLSLRSLIQVVRIAQTYEKHPDFESMVDYVLTNE